MPLRLQEHDCPLHTFTDQTRDVCVGLPSQFKRLSMRSACGNVKVTWHEIPKRRLLSAPVYHINTSQLCFTVR